MYSRLVKRPHRSYQDLWLSEDPSVKRLFTELSQPAMPWGRLKEISGETGIPFKTLQDWRARLKENPAYKPAYIQKGYSLRVDWETEEEIASFFRENYIQKQRYCPAALVKGKIEQYVFEKHGEEFVAGRTYIKNFLKRHNLSLRTPHVRRPTAPDDKKVAEFLMDVECACEQFTDVFYLQR